MGVRRGTREEGEVVVGHREVKKLLPGKFQFVVPNARLDLEFVIKLRHLFNQ